MTEQNRNDAAAEHAMENPAERYHLQIAAELNIGKAQVAATADLLGEGATVPFIARYRKEVTGSLDEVADHRDPRPPRPARGTGQAARGDPQIARGARAPHRRACKAKIAAAETLAVLEDIYLPFRPKRRTRATVAREKGLEPLAQRIFAQEEAFDPLAEAAAFVDPEKGVATRGGGPRRGPGHHRRMGERKRTGPRPDAGLLRGKGRLPVQGHPRARRRRGAGTGTTSTGKSRRPRPPPTGSSRCGAARRRSS